MSGSLRFSEMVMYDRQAAGVDIVDDLTGAKLEFVPGQIVGLGQFAEAYPDGVVLSRDTGFPRDYGRKTCAGYDTIDQQPFLWDVTGRALEGPLAGATLEPLEHGDHFWFAWAAFVPHTTMWTAGGVLSLSDDGAT